MPPHPPSGNRRKALQKTARKLARDARAPQKAVRSLHLLARPLGKG
ncbi:MAG: hypothetical protein JW999_02095 [Methanotrichaceae archaeon]|nr:hypothetical protein [Methanotrichaceae archaeon]